MINYVFTKKLFGIILIFYEKTDGLKRWFLIKTKMFANNIL